MIFTVKTHLQDQVVGIFIFGFIGQKIYFGSLPSFWKTGGGFVEVKTADPNTQHSACTCEAHADSRKAHCGTALVISINFNQRTLCGAAAKGRALHHRFRRARAREEDWAIPYACTPPRQRDDVLPANQHPKIHQVWCHNWWGAWCLNNKSSLVPAVKNKRPSFLSLRSRMNTTNQQRRDFLGATRTGAWARV